MAAVTATIADVKILEGDDDAPGYPGESNNFRLKRAVVYVTNGATAVTASTDTLDVNLSTAISGKVRNGKTPTVRSWAIYQCASTGAASYAATATLSTNTLSITPTTSDWSTAATVAASALSGKKPFGILVAYSEA